MQLSSWRDRRSGVGHKEVVQQISEQIVLLILVPMMICQAALLLYLPCYSQSNM